MRKKVTLPCFLLTALCFWTCTGTGTVRTDIANTGLKDTGEMDVAVYPQMGHSNWVRSVTFSPDGRMVLSGSNDNTLKLWDVATGRELRTFSGHTGIVNSVTFSPDGRQVLSGSYDNTLKLWDAVTGREIRTFKGHTGYVNSVAFSPDGKQVISGSSDNTLKLWDVLTGQEIRTFSGHTETITSVAFSPNGRQILSGSYDKTVKLWDVRTGRQIRTIRVYIVTSVEFSPNGRQVLVGEIGGNFRVHDSATGNEIRFFADEDINYGGFSPSVTFSPNGRQILSGYLRNFKLWDAATGQEVRTFSGHTETINSVAFSPDGKLVLSGSNDNTLRLWDAETGQEIRTFSGNSNWVNSVAFNPSAKQILTGSDDSTMKLWDTEAGREIMAFTGHENRITSAAVSPDGKLALSGSNDNTLKLWDTATGEEIRTLSGHTGFVNSVTFSPDGKQALSCSDDNTIKLWDTAAGQEIRSLTGHKNWINSATFSPDGKQILSGANDNTLMLWDAVSGQEIRTLSGHDGPIDSVTFSPDGKMLLSGSWDSTIKLWDAASGQEIKTFQGHAIRVFSVTFSPDGKMILSGSGDNTVKLWDIESGREIKTFSGHNSRISSVAFSTDGKLIISGSTDGTTRLWDIESGKEISQFISYNDGEWIAITPEGYYNASPSGDRYLNVRVGNSVYGIDQYRDTFYNPALVALALSDRSEYLAAVQQTIQDTAAPPSIVVTSPSAVASAASTSISVSVDGGSQSIQYLTVNVNGRIIARDIGVTPVGTKGLAPIARLAVLADKDANKKQVSFNLDIPLDPGSNIIEVLAFNGFSEGRALVEVSYNTTQSNLPDLYILSIGVGRYTDPSVPNLRFAPNDAKGIVAAFKTQEGRRYGQVRSLILADGGDREPTRDNISDGMDFLRSARQSDIILLFLSGHGGTDDLGQFFFMPGNMAFNQNGTPQRSRIIPNNELQEVLRFPGQKLVFIDSCYSGGFTGNQAGTVDNDTLINSLKDDAPVIFTSSSKTQQSWEWESASLGLFTHVLIQGLSGTADANRDGRITVEELGDYVKKTVPGMKDSQQPYYWSPPGYRDFVIAVTGR